MKGRRITSSSGTDRSFKSLNASDATNTSPKLAQPRFLQRAEHPARNRRHRKVDGSGLEFLHRLKRRASVHTQLHSRVERVKTFQPRQHPAPQRRLARPYGYAPRLQAHRLRQFLAPPPELLAARFHMRVKNPPLGRELHPAPVAYEQPTPEFPAPAPPSNATPQADS